MKTNCLIVDDEPYAIDLIAHHLSSFEDMTVVAGCGNVHEAIKGLHSSKIDLMFLDINMPDIDGVSFLKNLQHPPAVIFTTAYREHALEAFELGVVDYLLKPVSFLRFAKAIDRYRALKQENDSVPAMKRPMIIKSGYEYIKIVPDDILYIQSKKDYAEIVTADKKVLTRTTMKQLVDQLPEGSFMQVHKSYIVPVSKVSSISANTVSLAGIKIPVGRSYIAMIKDRIERV